MERLSLRVAQTFRGVVPSRYRPVSAEAIAAALIEAAVTAPSGARTIESDALLSTG